MDTENITNLASLIAINTARIQEYLTKESLEGPSFDINAPKKFLIPSEAKDIEAARQAVIDASSKLRSLMLGPTDCLLSNTVRSEGKDHCLFTFITALAVGVLPFPTLFTKRTRSMKDAESQC